ncbi:MAG: hypothetical protein ACLU30_11005 [Odoribacter splanchnicus]
MKPHAIGDMRHITVPYAIVISVIRRITNDFIRYGRTRDFRGLGIFLYTLMVEVEKFIR